MSAYIGREPLQRIGIDFGDTLPAAGQQGQLFYKTDTKVVYFWKDGFWELLLDESRVGKNINQLIEYEDDGLGSPQVNINKLKVGNILSDTVVTSWDSVSDVHTHNKSITTVTSVHEKMRRCVLNLNGTVNYYLDPNDSNFKENGDPSNLTGIDGYVMVEIPKFYFSYTRRNNVITWKISEEKIDSSYVLHPAFIKNNVEVDYRYYSAYDACVNDTSVGSYISGTNLNDASGLINFSTDRLASVSGVYPMVGLTRSEFRTLARNIGSGWEQADFWLVSAIQLLFTTEFSDFNSQSILGDGNTKGSFIGSSSNQDDSPLTIAGASNTLGNNSTNRTSGVGTDNKPGTSFMNYRGIENFYGNCWDWVDGINILDRVVYITDDHKTSLYVDDTSSGLTNIGNVPVALDDFIVDILDHPGTFIGSDVNGGSSTTFLTDALFTTPGDRVALFGGSADDGESAGVFYWLLNHSSSVRNRDRGARVTF